MSKIFGRCPDIVYIRFMKAIQITDKALDSIRTNNTIIGRLMGAFDKKCSATIENWINRRDVRLTTPTAVQIISEETGLSSSEILVDVVAEAV